MWYSVLFCIKSLNELLICYVVISCFACLILQGDMKNKVVIAENEAATAEEPNPKGIPEFWFTIFRNVDMLSELVQVSASAPRGVQV